MRKNYTILLLLISFSILAQNAKVEPTSDSNVSFREVDGKIELFASNSRSGVPSSSFSSPNEVIITQDELGNKYWYIIDGTIVKSEIVTRTGITSYDNESSQQVKQTSMSDQTLKSEQVPKVVSDTQTTKLIDIPETKGEQATDSQIKVITTETKKIETAPAQKAIENPTSTEFIPGSKTPESTTAPEGKIKQIVIEEIEQPSVENQPAVTTPKVTEQSSDETIQITQDEIGDTSDLFEKNYEDMSRKEKKLYKKNEKKIMRQLEKELKNQNEE